LDWHRYAYAKFRRLWDYPWHNAFVRDQEPELTAVAHLHGGPANGRRFPIDGDGWPHEVTVPAEFFRGWVDAVYVSQGTAHSVGNGATQVSYRYRLPDGTLDEPRERLDPRDLQQRAFENEPTTAVRADGMLNVWFADGPLAGLLGEITGAVHDGHGPAELGDAGLPGLTGWYATTSRLEAREGVVYEVYLHRPL
jgi:hypothetical protein